ncbi:MAG: signal transduction histidine kinase/ligand-binding sensor domain-containing protein [Phycisphaerales bacterium]|jgi:signal transduction histidine kinase/ligand-binding sensor domain-containing protein
MSVTCVAQTPDGFLWIGTFGGLARFDGYRFETYSMSTVSELGSSRVTALYVDREGVLWIGSQFGDVARYREGEFEQMKKRDVSAEFQVHWFAEDQEGTLWADVDGGRWFDRTTQKLRSDRTIEHVIKQRLAGLELDRVDQDRVKREARIEIPNRTIRSVFQDRDGQYWIGFTGGLALFIKQPFFEVQYAEKFLPGAAFVVADDGQGGLYFTVGNAPPLMRLNEAGGVNPVPNVPVGMIGTNWSLLTARDGTLWTLNTDSLSNRRDGVWSRYPYPFLSMGLPSNLVEDSRGLIWFGAPGRLVSFDGESFEEHHAPGKTTAPESPQDESTSPYSLMIDREDSIWFVQDNQIWHRVGDEITEHRKDPGSSYGEIRTFHQASDGTVWIGSYGGGIARFDDGEFRWIDGRHGLLNDSVSQILDDGTGTLWLNTNAGLISCTLEDANAVADGRIERLRCRSFNMSECVIGIGVRTSSGLLAMPNSAGLLVVDPRVTPAAAAPPRPELTEVSSGTKAFPVSGEVEIPMGDRDIAVGFTAPWLHDPGNAEFEHRLIGLHDEWRAGGSDRHIRYGDLDPGRYRFEVRTVGEDGTRSEKVARIDLRIPALFYELVWVRIGAGLLAVGFCVLLYEHRAFLARRRHRRLTAEVEHRRAAERSTRELAGHLINSQEFERSRIARDLHDDLGQRLALVSIKAGTIAHSEEPQPETIQSICDDLRSISRDVHDISHSLHPAKLDQLGLVLAVRAFCHEITKAELVEIDFETHGEIDTLTPAVKLCLYRVIQEALRNVVKHSEATRAEVMMTVNAKTVCLEISDNGQGFDVEGNTGGGDTRLGLLSMRERVRFAGGQISVDSSPGKGTLISVILSTDLEPQDPPKTS